MNTPQSGDPWAEVKRLQAELAKTEKAYQNYKTDLEITIRQRDEARAQLAAIEEALAQVQRESAELREERDGIRNATVKECANVAKSALDERSWGPDPRIGSIIANNILALYERPSLLSPAKQSVFDAAIERQEKGEQH